jgi:hypothetical protein
MIFKSTRCSSIIATSSAIVEQMIVNGNTKLDLGFLLFEMLQVFDPSEVEIHTQAARSS